MIIRMNHLEFRNPLTARAKTEFLVYHHAKAINCTLEDIHSWHIQNGWSGVGYHFFIRKDGTVYEGRPIWAMGAHVSGYNDCSLGVCFEGDFEVEQMTNEQIKAGIELALYVRNQYPNIRLCRHKDLGQSECPGKNFNDNIILKGSANVEQKHWCDDIYKELTEKYGLTINEKRFDDKITRGEVFALIRQILKLIVK